MKRLFTTIIAISAFVAFAEAQTTNGVVVESYTMERSGDYVSVDIELDLSDLDVKNKQAITLTPYIVRDESSRELRSIGIYGRNRHFYFARNEEKKPTTTNDIDYRKNKLPNKISYRDIIPFEKWMDGCRLVFMRVDYGCVGTAYDQHSDILVDRFPAKAYQPQLIYVHPTTSSEKIYTINGSAFIDFPVNKMDIRPDYRNNNFEIAKITGTIDSVRNDKDITIKSIAIKGFASPEGSYSNNELLAQGRTEALREYVENLYKFEEGFITTSYEPEDWAGFEKFVAESDIEHKEEILAAIHSDREPDNKEWYIKSNWKTDYEYLLTHCYPALRHSDYTIEYTVRHYTSAEEIETIMNTAPQKLSLEEFHTLAQTYEAGSDKLNELYEIAVRMYPDDEIANLNAANSAISSGDYERALRYLDKAGNRPEVIYTRGAIEVMKENTEAALPYLEEAKKLGVAEAAPTIEAVGNHWKVSSKK